MLTLGQLVTPVTEAQALATILTVLQQAGFQATSWDSGSIQLTTLSLFAKTWSKITTTIAEIAAGGFTTLAGTEFLTLLARYIYDIERLAAQPTIGQFLLTSTAVGVTTWGAGDIIISNSPNGTPGAQTYTVTGGGSLGPSSSASVEFKADIAGAAGNIAPGSTLYFWTPIPGISATNPALVPTSNTWITTPGADEESNARLTARCLGRWSRLTYGNTDGAYMGWALEALPALTRVAVSSAPGDGRVTLIGATAAGPIDAGQITTIVNYVTGMTDGVGRRPINDIFTAQGATIATSPGIIVTAYGVSSVVDTAGPLITAALLAFIGTVPLGGTVLQGTSGYVLYDDLLDTAKNAVPGVRSVSLSITGNVPLLPGQIYLPAITVSVLPVAPGVS